MREDSFRIPDRDGEILVVPEFASLRKHLRENQERLSSARMEINGRPLATLRQELRASLPSFAIPPLASSPLADPSAPFVMTGHQPEFSHPGIWLKNHLAHAVAKQCGGVGINLIVDSDIPHQRAIRFPAVAGGQVQQRSLVFLAERPGLAYEEFSVGDGADFSPIHAAAEDPAVAKGIRESLRTLSGLLESRSGGSVVMAITKARQAYEAESGIGNHEILLSRLSATPAFQHFFLHILANLDSFSRVYNESLETYRQRHGIRSPANPLPNLEPGETPFWAWTPGKDRHPLFVRRKGDRFELVFVKHTIGELCLEEFEAADGAARQMGEWRRSGLRLRPRALATTMFCRLFLADLFIHGVGGGKYDVVTDQIIERFFGLTPPVYAVATGTFHLPLEAVILAAGDMNRLRYQVRDIHHNPTRYAPDTVRTDSRFLALGEEKRQVLASMGIRNKAGKYSAFVHTKEINRRMAGFLPAEAKALEQQLEAARSFRRQRDILKDRSYPFFLFPRETIPEALRRAGIGS